MKKIIKWPLIYGLLMIFFCTEIEINSYTQKIICTPMCYCYTIFTISDYELLYYKKQTFQIKVLII